MRVRVGRSQIDMPRDVSGLSRGDLADRVRTLNPGVNERTVAIAVRALSPSPPPRTPRKFNAAPRPEPPTPMIEVGRGTRPRASDQRERIIINRPPTSAAERRELADALTNAITGVSRL